ncbi:hypothetical protein NHF48_003375 [Sphingomonas sp. H160509]|nr:hypothetical protein [Sphingomonas sp. H160509]MDD1450233.1 hypothetical protein [Sphingomonas sp. H160509]
MPTMLNRRSPNPDAASAFTAASAWAWSSNTATIEWLNFMA